MPTLSSSGVYSPTFEESSSVNGSKNSAKPNSTPVDLIDKTKTLKDTAKINSAYKKPFLNKTKKCFFVGLMVLAVTVGLKPTLETHVFPVSGEQASKCVELVLATEARFELTDAQTKRAENCIYQVKRYAEANEKQLGFADVNPKIMAMRDKYFPSFTPAEQSNANKNSMK